MTHVVMVSDSPNTLVVPGGWASAKALPHDSGAINSPTYTFWIRPRNVGAAATVNITATDSCGSWSTLAGTGGVVLLLAHRWRNGYTCTQSHGDADARHANDWPTADEVAPHLHPYPR
jgi:hypothetical protein